MYEHTEVPVVGRALKPLNDLLKKPFGSVDLEVCSRSFKDHFTVFQKSVKGPVNVI